MGQVAMSVRVDERVKAKAEQVLQGLGIPMNGYVNMCLVALAQKGGIPFDATYDKTFWHPKDAPARSEVWNPLKDDNAASPDLMAKLWGELQGRAPQDSSPEARPYIQHVLTVAPDASRKKLVVDDPKTELGIRRVLSGNEGPAVVVPESILDMALHRCHTSPQEVDALAAFPAGSCERWLEGEVPSAAERATLQDLLVTLADGTGIQGRADEMRALMTEANRLWTWEQSRNSR